MACLFGDGSARQQVLEQAVYNAYAKALREPLREVIHNECYGCQIDHPSQKQHNVCLFMSFDEQVDCFLQEALKRVDEMRVTEAWMSEIETIFPNQDISHILLQEFIWDMPDFGTREGLRRLGSLIKEQEKNNS